MPVRRKQKECCRRGGAAGDSIGGLLDLLPGGPMTPAAPDRQHHTTAQIDLQRQTVATQRAQVHKA